METFLKRFLALAILFGLYLLHPVLGLAGLVGGFGYEVAQRVRGLHKGDDDDLVPTLKLHD